MQWAAPACCLLLNRDVIEKAMVACSMRSMAQAYARSSSQAGSKKRGKLVSVCCTRTNTPLCPCMLCLTAALEY